MAKFEPDNQARDRVEAVERAIAILQCFKQAGEILTLTALSQRSGLYKSTVLRLAGSLQHTGFLERTAEGRYILGPELRRLGALSQASFTLETIIRPVLTRLTATTQETASFYVREADERVCLYRENSPRSARHHLEEGMRHPLASGAAGAVLTLFGDKEASGPLADQLRQTGSIVSIGGRDADLAAVAVPLVNSENRLLGALAVSGLISRFDHDHIAAARELLTQEAASLRQRLPPDVVVSPHKGG